MSSFSILASTPGLFMVTGVFPQQRKVRVSALVYNPLHGYVQGQRRILGWLHMLLDGGNVSPGSLVQIHNRDGVNAIAQTVSYNKKVAA